MFFFNYRFLNIKSMRLTFLKPVYFNEDNHYYIRHILSA